MLHGVDVSVEPGTITALIGPSGGGKTTLLRTLSLLDPPDCGLVTVDSETYRFPWVGQGGLRPPWPKVTVVFQQLFLWPHLTLRRNITLPLDGKDQRTTQTELDRLISLFEMRSFIDRYPNETSLGQRQRAAIARALLLMRVPEFLATVFR